MSDTENTATDVNKNNKTESSDTESSTQNFVIPLVLLLVSAIVIVATFYEDEYSDMLASSDSQTISSEDASANETIKAGNTESYAQPAVSRDAKAESADKTSENIATATETQTSTIASNALSVTTDGTTTARNTIDEDSSVSVADANKSGQKTDSVNETNKAENTPLDEQLTVNSDAKTESADITSENITVAAIENQTSTITHNALIVTTDNITADKNTIGEDNLASVADAKQNGQNTDSVVAMHSMPAINDADTAPVPHQRNLAEPNQPNDAIKLPRKLTYEQSKARAQQQAKQRHEMMQQRRQAHAKEIQSRRQQYEVAMKAREEKRVQIIDARKALHKRVQQNRLATKQTREEAHKRIAELHEEIHQIMKRSLYTSKQPVVTQTKKIDVEHM